MRMSWWETLWLPFIALGLLSCQSTPQLADAGLTVRFLSQELPLDPAAPVYHQLSPLKVSVYPQLLIHPYASQERPPIYVRAAHNGGELVFLVEWSDDTLDREDHQEVDKFADACAIMFPQGEVEEATAAALMMGFLKPVRIWYWKNGQPAQSLEGKGPGTLKRIPDGFLSCKALYRDGGWHLVFKGAFRLKGDHLWVAFAVWDGSKGERGPQKSISNWVRAYVE